MDQDNQKYLRQKVTGDIFVWTEILAIRDDMIECNVSVVKNRLVAMKEKLEAARIELENAKPITVELEADSKLLAQLELEYAETQEKIREKRRSPEEVEQAPESVEEAEAALNRAELEGDPEMIKIRDMKERKEIELYITAEYGEKIGPKKYPEIEDLRDRAFELRTARIQEK